MSEGNGMTVEEWDSVSEDVSVSEADAEGVDDMVPSDRDAESVAVEE